MKPNASEDTIAKLSCVSIESTRFEIPRIPWLLRLHESFLTYQHRRICSLYLLVRKCTSFSFVEKTIEFSFLIPSRTLYASNLSNEHRVSRSFFTPSIVLAGSRRPF